MEATSQPAPRGRTLGALESRDFRLLWGGQTISLIGDAAFIVALGWKTFTLTGSTGSLAIVLLAHSLAMLTTLLIGGVLADRYPRRTLMIVSDVARFGVIAALAFTDAAGALTFPLLIAFAVGFGLGDGFFYPAFGAIVPLVVDEHRLASANALVNISRQASFVVGPALAGGIYHAAGSAAVFAFDAATFAVAAGLAFLARPRSYEPEPREGPLLEMTAGFRYVMSEQWLWMSIFVASFVLLITMAPYQALLPSVVEDEFGRGVGAYSALFTFQAAGMVAGSLAFSRINPRRSRMSVMCVSFALNDVCVIAFVVLGSYEAAAVLVTLRGACIGFGMGVWSTLMMELVPESKLARATSVDFFGSLGLTPVGFALTAVVSGWLSPLTILLAGYCVATMLWIAPLSSRRFRAAA